jgi:hypothetical protein
MSNREAAPTRAASLLLAAPFGVIQNVAAWGPANNVRGVSGVKDLLFVALAPPPNANTMIHSDLPKWDWPLG